MMEWIKCSDRLPPQGVYVIGHYNGGNWKDKDDQFGCELAIVKIEHGISAKQREAMHESDPRKKRICRCDEHGNNKLPYYWDTFGPSTFLSTDIDMWMPAPKPPSE